MRVVLVGFLLTAVQRQLCRSAPVRTSFSIASLINPCCALFRSSSFTLNVSIVQYSVSVMFDGVGLIEEKDGRLVAWLACWWCMGNRCV